MATNALHAIAIKAFRDRLASLGIDPLEVIKTASRGRGATASAQSPPLRMRFSKQPWPCPATPH